MFKVNSIVVLLGLALLSLGCHPEVYGTTDDDDAGGDDDDSMNCLGDFTILPPQGGTAKIDGCVDYDIDATYEFDPDKAPEVRTFSLEFHATTESAWECWVRVEQSGVCGEGYYLMGEGHGSVTFATFDCTGVADEYEGQFTSDDGYIHLTTLDTGSESGNFTGEPLYTALGGSLSISTPGGVSLLGDFLVTEEIVGIDAEEHPCNVSDGDADGDGYVSDAFDGEDCDDGDASTHPGADEEVDGLDNDCDGIIDDNTVVFDDDGDGYSENDGDCDDSDSQTYPGSNESCDGSDNDCDGSVDEGAADGCSTYYRDSDGDGYGLDSDTSCLCAPAAPYDASQPGDCDDTNGWVYPGAQELCDGSDNDCDSVVESAFEFNSTYAIASYSDDFLPSASGLTVEAWIKPDFNLVAGAEACGDWWCDWARVVALEGISPHCDDAEWQIVFWSDSGELLFIDQNTDGVGISGITGGVWHHVAYELTASNQARAYLDGVLVDTGAFTATPGDDGGLQVTFGAKYQCDAYVGYDGAFFFLGSIDEIRVSRAQLYNGLSPFTPDPYLTVESSTRALWRLDERSGTTVSDASGYGHTATLSSSSGWTNDAPLCD